MLRDQPSFTVWSQNFPWREGDTLIISLSLSLSLSLTSLEIFRETRYKLKQRHLITNGNRKKREKKIARPADFTFVDATRFQQSPDTITDRGEIAQKLLVKRNDDVEELKSTL